MINTMITGLFGILFDINIFWGTSGVTVPHRD